MRAATFSLILATVGRTSELDRFFNSLAAQSVHDFEVIVVDQNPDARLQPHLMRASSLGLVIRHLKHAPPNLAAARNTGIEAASGQWLAFPDDDCWYDADLLASIAASAAKESLPDGVIARWVEQGPPLCGVSALSWDRSRIFRDIPVSSITLFIRRAVLERIGGFDSRLGLGQWFGAAEETDLVMRALQNGARMVHEPGALVHHAFTPGQPALDRKARLAARRRARGTGALYAKHGLPLGVVLRGLAAPVLRPLMKGAFGAELAHGCAVSLGRLDGMLGWDSRDS